VSIEGSDGGKVEFPVFLGGHCLYFAKHDRMALMGTEKATAVFMDPPYNVPIDGHVSSLGQIRHREFVMAAGEMTPEGFTQFLETALGLLATSSCPDSLIYVCKV
jgi:hypothetical protein